MPYLSMTGKYLLPILIVLVGLSGFRSATFSLEHVRSGAPPTAYTLLIAWLAGTLLGPLLLPWIPGPSLAIKATLTGLLGVLSFPAACFFLHLEPLDVVMALLVIPSVASFLVCGSPYEKTEANERLRAIRGRSVGFLRFSPWNGVGIGLFAFQVIPVALATGLWIVTRFI